MNTRERFEDALGLAAILAYYTVISLYDALRGALQEVQHRHDSRRNTP